MLKFSIKKQSVKIVKFVLFLFIILFTCIVLSKVDIYTQANSLSYFKLRNSSNFEKELTTEDIQQIFALNPFPDQYRVDFWKNEHRVLTIKKFDCQKEKESQLKPNRITLVEYPTSQKCQSGDYLFDIGTILNPQLPLGMKKRGRYFLVRKTGSQWIVVEEFPEYYFMS